VASGICPLTVVVNDGPGTICVGAGIALALAAGRLAIGNPGAHGLSEIVYAFTSSANSNGSAFAGLSPRLNRNLTALHRKEVVV